MSDTQQSLWSDDDIYGRARYFGSSGIDAASSYWLAAKEMRDDMQTEIERLHTIANSYRRSALDKLDRLNLIVEKLGYAGLWDDTDEDADPDPVELVQAARERIAELEARLVNAQPAAQRYSHRNGETEPPTIVGYFWFRGRARGYPVAQKVTVMMFADGSRLRAIGVEESSYLEDFDGQWWGPEIEVAPWEQPAAQQQPTDAVQPDPVVQDAAEARLRSITFSDDASNMDRYCRGFNDGYEFALNQQQHPQEPT